MPTPPPVIAHFDLDAFFAAVEQYDKPSLAGRPVVVGGTGPRGVVATASYEARRFNVHSAMPTAQARLRCPQAVFLSPRIARYRTRSARFHQVLGRYSPVIESMGMDEAFCDLSSICSWDDPRAIELAITGIRDEITTALHVPVSAGISTSKLIAKLATSAAKPHGQRLVTPGSEVDFIRPLPVTDLPGVGPATAQRLDALGIPTVAALAALPLSTLITHFKESHGTRLYELAHAIDRRPLAPDAANKSLHAEHTFETDLSDPAELHAALDRLVTTVARRLVSHPQAAYGVTLKIRRADFSSVTRSATSRHPLTAAAPVREMAHRLLDTYLASPAHAGGIRLLGVATTGLSDTYQTSFAFDAPISPAPEDHPTPDPATPEISLTVGTHLTHDHYGTGWVEEATEEAIAIRFEGPGTPPGPRRVFDLPMVLDHLTPAELPD